MGENNDEGEDTERRSGGVGNPYTSNTVSWNKIITIKRNGYISRSV